MARRNSNKTASSNQAVEPKLGCYAIHLVAGATGDLLHRLGQVAATQFSGIGFRLISHAMQSDLETLEKTLLAIDEHKAIIVHALPTDSAKQLVRAICVRRRIPHFDATGPLLNFIADCVGVLPDNDLSRLHRVDAAYQKRIDAMEFALAHDDGLGLQTLREADIVIVGVSRVGKSPTMLYLSSRGFKVANVSISPETGFPAMLARTAKRKIVALTIQPRKLQEIREARLRESGVASSNYDELKHVIREVMDAEAEYRRRGYPVIDVTTNTIEQTASRIMEALSLTPP
jgi:regulator of PEP synthase PpsR (kinase-PPPase family)